MELSMTSSNSVVSMPVLRPLIAFDKADIIKIDFSNLPARDARDPKDRWE